MQTSCSLIHAVLLGISSNTNRTIPTAAEEMSGAATAANEIKYRGVRKRKWGKYVAEIRLPNSRERIWLGSYDAAEKAARAFDAALFCLRGRAANFNFSDDPPEIEGGESLPAHEIQAVAQRYGNSYGRGRHDQTVAADAEDGARAVQEDAAGFDGTGSVDLIDRSFWEMIDVNGGSGGAAAECNVDYGDYFLEVNEMLVDYEARVYEDDECFDHILWTF